MFTLLHDMWCVQSLFLSWFFRENIWSFFSYTKICQTENRQNFSVKFRIVIVNKKLHPLLIFHIHVHNHLSDVISRFWLSIQILEYPSYTFWCVGCVKLKIPPYPKVHLQPLTFGVILGKEEKKPSKFHQKICL